MAANHDTLAGNAQQLYFESATLQHVKRRNGFHLFKTIC